MWFCIEKIIANTSINNVYCSLSLKIDKYIYRKYQSQESSLQISAGNRTFVRQIWGFWLANTESDRTCWLGSSVMTRNKKYIFSLKKDKRYVRPNGLLVPGLTYDRLIGKSYLQAWELIIIVIGRFDSFTKIQLSNFGTTLRKWGEK